ncbi:MAG: hypothetical protein SGI73_10210 [Chloroflexota bacterium]|nr:hypothetical protein [Chloroflexota bacterium]
MTEQIEMPAASPPRRRSPIRRAGCVLALIVWFIVLLLPCGLIVIATQGEIAISQGELPGQAIRVWLINEADQRGFGTAATSIYQPSDANTVCMQTDNRFLFWYGRAQAAVSYCECFIRAAPADEWGFLSVSEGVCGAASLEAGERMP